MSEKKSKFGLFGLLFKLGPKVLTILGKLLKTLKFGKVAMAAATFTGYAVVFNCNLCCYCCNATCGFLFNKVYPW